MVAKLVRSLGSYSVHVHVVSTSLYLITTKHKANTFTIYLRKKFSERLTKKYLNNKSENI